MKIIKWLVNLIKSSKTKVCTPAPLNKNWGEGPNRIVGSEALSEITKGNDNVYLRNAYDRN